MNLIKTLGIAAALTITSTTASVAATFDFAGAADTYWSASSPHREPDWATIKAWDAGNGNAFFADGGIELTDVNAKYNGDYSSDVYGFFDHDSGGSTAAGLGVCHKGFNAAGESLCSTGVSGATTSDDNVTNGEELELIFDQAVKITNMSFFNGSHHPANGWIEIGGVEYEIENGGIKAGQAAIAASNSFWFGYADGRQSGATQFYLTTMTVAAVPVPASMLLLAGALGGFGAMRRRKNKATA